MNLFQIGSFTLNSGQTADYKIECDALTDDDIACLCALLRKRLPAFCGVLGVPRGGVRIANALTPYATRRQGDPFLIVDDVFTTGGSMDRQRLLIDVQAPVIGAVLFARMKPPEWITPLFLMSPEYEK